MALNSTPITWGAGNVVTAAQLNTELRDPITGIQAVWTTYTPTTTNITIGNGSVVGNFTRIGKTVDFFCQFTFGSTSALTASPTFTLPVTALNLGWMAGECTAFDTSAAAYFPIGGVADTTARVLCRAWPTTAGNAFAGLSATFPMTWATGDQLTILGRYQAA